MLHLLLKQSFVDERVTDDEKSCFILWIWCKDPDALALRGTLWLAEPIEVGEDYFVRVGDMEWPDLCSEPAVLLDYETIIHLDKVLDYSGSPSSLSHATYESEVSGVPASDPMLC